MRGTLKSLVRLCLVVVGAISLISCATQKKEVSVVNDPDQKKGENSIPWNQQEKWEQGAEMGGMAEGTDHVR